MKITYSDNYENMSERAAQVLLNELEINKNLLLCPAAGNSPKGLYKHITKTYSKKPELFKKLKIIELDEWGGIPKDDENSCYSYLQKNLLKPLDISADRLVSFNPQAKNPEAECNRIQKVIDQTGPIDYCILGLGRNGHIGFNEPNSYLQSNCHVSKLSTESLQHSMSQSMSKTPSYGMTIGMKNILQSKKIILLVTGNNKESSIQKLLTGKITTELPASFLWLHPHVDCIIDQNSAPKK